MLGMYGKTHEKGFGKNTRIEASVSTATTSLVLIVAAAPPLFYAQIGVAAICLHSLRNFWNDSY
jgi:hypothetical protein